MTSTLSYVADIFARCYQLIPYAIRAADLDLEVRKQPHRVYTTMFVSMAGVIIGTVKDVR